MDSWPKGWRFRLLLALLFEVPILLHPWWLFVKRRSKYRYVSPCLIALVQLGLGEGDQTIASLEQG